jgi:biotin carboxyl carrier protein
MKTETAVHAPVSGRVECVSVRPGQVVLSGAPMMAIAPVPA